MRIPCTLSRRGRRSLILDVAEHSTQDKGGSRGDSGAQHGEIDLGAVGADPTSAQGEQSPCAEGHRAAGPGRTVRQCEARKRVQLFYRRASLLPRPSLRPRGTNGECRG